MHPFSRGTDLLPRKTWDVCVVGGFRCLDLENWRCHWSWLRVTGFGVGVVHVSASDLQALSSCFFGVQFETVERSQGALFSLPRNIPNRYTFPCPYCPEKNFDQEGLVEHCKLTHSTDTKSVVRIGFFFFD
jgi:hypothetical protein